MNRQHNASDIAVYEKRAQEDKGLNTTAKLTITDVRTIRRLDRDTNGKITSKELAARFGVTAKTIGKVRRGDTWPGV